MKSKYVVVVGCGRLGGLLANRLSGDGHDLVIIDKRERAFDKLSTEFTGYKIMGDATEKAVLKQAEIGRADWVFAVTTQDNVNLMVAQIAKKIYDVPLVVARIYDTAREKVYREFEIETISPTKLTADAFMQLAAAHTNKRA